MLAQPGLAFPKSGKARVHCPIPLSHSINTAFLSPFPTSYPSSLFPTHACSLVPTRLRWRIWQSIVSCSSFDAAKFPESKASFTAITIIRCFTLYFLPSSGTPRTEIPFYSLFFTLCRTPPFRYPFPLRTLLYVAVVRCYPFTWPSIWRNTAAFKRPNYGRWAGR